MMTNASDILEQLNSRDLRERLDQIEAERKALMVLLRSARARERELKSTSANREGATQ